MGAQTHPVDAEVTTVFLANQAALERYARSLTRDEDAAADICQDVFIRLLVVARSGRMPDVPAAWMRRVAHNCFVSSARQTTTRTRILERFVESDVSVSTEDAVVRRERDHHVRRALESVRPFEREAIVLAAEGYPSAEIGQALGRTAMAARTLLCRARGQVRAQLDSFDAA
ncbi:MAG TPA: sigma-70 family RNA polymerase sigma factor [Verrucomicrobiae bacterium]|nr:sigma-70 family RNA polymerase sigma factor [Verrucomicrobiae bacterium]